MLNRNTYDHSAYHRAVTGRSRRSSFGLLRAFLTFTWRLPFNLFRRLRAVYRFARDFDVREFDARWFIPRPADEPELDSYQAGLRFSADVLDGLLTLFFTAAATTVAALAAGQLQVAGLYEPTFPALIWTTVALLIVFALGLVDLSLLWLPYLRLNQRLTHGSQRWADIPTLAEMGLARRRGKPLEPGALVVGRLSRGYDFVLPFKTVLNGVSIYGPPESGKTTTFFLTMIRALAPTTAMIINDPKREIYRQTAHLFDESFRLDLDRPELSDLWNPAPECAGDRELADVMAAAIVDFDPERHRQGNAQFWASAVASVITAGLLRLTEMLPAATLPFLSEFIALRTKEELHNEMDRSKIHEVKVHWGNFSKADPEKTQGNILTSVQTNFRALYTPNARAVLRTPTPEELKRGVREIDFDILKYPRRAIFITLPEEDDNRYRTLITLFSQLASRSLRRARDAGHTDTPCIFFLDEAGNNAPPDLDRKTAVGRGRLLGHVLGLQTIMQFDTRFGGDKAKSIRDIIGTSIFLPGIGLETARYAADLIGKTTVLSRTSVDVKAGESRDDERLGEAARYLRDPAELRQLVKHQQGVAIVGSAPPDSVPVPAANHALPV